MYERFWKRVLDVLFSGAALVLLSPVFLLLTVVGAVAMGGNPFFVQTRPGKDGKLFDLIKFRSMGEQKGPDGQLLPDALRLTRYGQFIRATSVDELPELINILKGDMSIVGPRPLLVKYLPLYNEVQRHRHDVRPGLTGLAQVSGRNAISWEEKFSLDVAYVGNITFFGDMKIMLRTVGKVLVREGISPENAATVEAFLGTPE